TTDGVVYQSIVNPDLSAKDADAGTRDKPNFLVLFATGLRNTPAASVTVKFQGVPGRVDFAGAVMGLTALDQITVVIPPELAGIGALNVDVSVPGRAANRVTMRLGGQPPPVRVTPIAFGETKTGALTVDDQVQIDNSKPNRPTFFF